MGAKPSRPGLEGTAPGNTTFGTSGREGGRKAQCSSYVAPCLIHSDRIDFSSALKGFSIEGGQLRTDRSDVDFGDLTAAGSIYLGIDSPVGPLYVAYGRTEGDLNANALYISLGWPFLTNQARIGR